MPPKKSNTPTTEPAAEIPLLTDFCTDDADVIIRAAGTLDFRVHKFILSLVSPFFKDMFTLPQPPSDTPETLPHVDVHQPPKTWENILRTIYPGIENPTIETLDDLQSLLSAARLYEMESVIKAHKKAFKTRAFIEEDSLRLFSIACGYGFEDQATYVARNAELLGVTERFDSSNTKGLTLDAYGRFLSFLVKRDHEWRRVLRDARIPPHHSCKHCEENQSRESFYKKIKEDLHRPSLGTHEIYVRALEHRANCGSKCTWSGGPFGSLEIKTFVERMGKEREKVYDLFQPKKWYYGFATTFRPNFLVDIILLGS